MPGELRNEVKARLATGEPCYIMAIRSARTIDIVGMARATGHHAFYVDLQHSTIGADLAAQLCLAGLFAGITPLVRIPGLDRPLCEQVLEGGALGIIVPDLRTHEEAAEVGSWCAFPPSGTRSSVNAGAHTRFAAPDQARHREAIAGATIVIAMLESEAGMREARAIAAVPAVGALMIGSTDLTSSMGLHGQYEHPRVRELIISAIDGARSHDKPVIIGGVRDPAVLARYVAAGGARCFVTGTDTAFLMAGATAQVGRFRSIESG